MAEEDESVLRTFFDELTIALAKSMVDLPIQDLFGIQLACLRIRSGKVETLPIVISAPDGTILKLDLKDEINRAIETLKDAPNVVISLYGAASALALHERGVNVVLVGTAKEPEPPKEVVH